MTQIHKFVLVIATVGVLSLLNNLSNAHLTQQQKATQQQTTNDDNSRNHGTSGDKRNAHVQSQVNALININHNAQAHADSVQPALQSSAETDTDKVNINKAFFADSQVFVNNIYQGETGRFYLESPVDAEHTGPEQRPSAQGNTAQEKKAQAPKARFAVLPIEHSHFDVDVVGKIARTTLTQRFVNRSSTWQNGIYVFPLPQDAAVDALSMRIGERLIKGEIKEKQAAQDIFKAAKQAGKSASLLEQIRPNMFVNKVANLAPGDSITVTLEYQQVLTPKNGRYSLRIPSAITPRYAPKDASQSAIDAASASLHTMPIDMPVDLDIRVRLNTGLALASINSIYPEHPIAHKLTDTNHHEVLLIKADNAQEPSSTIQSAFSKNFVLTWTLRQQSQVYASNLTEYQGEYQYGLLQLVPNSPPQGDKEGARAPRDISFILDTSGSMVGDAIEQAKAALSSAIDDLDSNDSFNIIEFNSRPSALFTQKDVLMRRASAQNKQRAKRFINSLQASGGTEIRAALELALELRDSKGEASEQVPYFEQMLFITDGSVSNEAQLLTLIKEKLSHTRLFTVGIGNAPNTYFMTEAAIAGRGAFSFIGDLSEVKSKMSELLAKIKQPVLSNVSLEATTTESSDKAHSNPEIEYFPKYIPDLYAGEALSVAYRVKSNQVANTGLTLKLNAKYVQVDKDGSMRTTPWSKDFSSDSLTEANIQTKQLSKHWAYSKIRQLNRNLHTSAASGEDYLALKHYTQQQVTQTALQHQLVSDYTSLIAVDEQVTRPSEKYLSMLQAQQKQISELRGIKWQAASVSLPQSDNGKYRWYFLSLVLSAFALSLYLLGRRI